MSYFYLNVWWPAEGLPAPSIFPWLTGQGETIDGKGNQN